MLTLAVDTTSPSGSVAVLSGAKVLAEAGAVGTALVRSAGFGRQRILEAGKVLACGAKGGRG